MSGKRSRSFKCAVHHRDRLVCSQNDFHLINQPPTFFQRYSNSFYFKKKKKVLLQRIICEVGGCQKKGGLERPPNFQSVNQSSKKKICP